MAYWLTLAELAVYLKRGRSTLYRMAQEAQIPAKKIGRSWRFDRDEIDAWLRSHAVRAPATRKKRLANRASQTRPK